MVDVFISYSRTDLAQVTQLARAVEAEGYQVWWDADLPPHLSYGDVITAKIGMAKAAIVVWSQDSAASEWVRAEADMARNQKKLVQTALDNVMPPLPFNQIQYAELGDWHGEPDHPGWRKVKVSLAELCGPREPSSEPRPAPRHVPVAPVVTAPPPVATASKWPLFAGIGVAVVALLGAAFVVIRGNADERAEAMAQRVAAEQAARSEPEAATPEQASSSQAAAQPVLVEGQGLAPEPAAPAAAPEPAPAAAAPVASTEGMVFPDSGRRLLRPAEIANLGPATLAIARNEIYARNGRRFRRADIRAYFEQFDWYRPVAFEVRLNRIEQQNVARLQAAEDRFGGGGQ
jgi:hypothetical protein